MQYARALYRALVNFLVEESHISEEQIVKGKSEECVDVRAVLINKMSAIGVTNKHIKDVLGCTPQAVSKILANYSNRYEQSLTVRKMHVDLDDHVQKNMVVLKDIVKNIKRQ